MRLADFHFHLPEELIAQEALADRKSSRMMLVDRAAQTFTDMNFSDITDILRAGDVLVINNTKVFPARLNGTLETGGHVEIFLVNETAPMTWEALARPAKRLKEGKVIFFGDKLRATVVGKLESGSVVVRFECNGDFDSVLEEIGRTPLPPYIKRDASSPDADRVRYQTVYAKERGAIAAPTAGLHFTPGIIETLKDKGVEVVEVTLHVGYGTFAPVRAEDLSQHSVMGERCEIPQQTADAVNRAKGEGRRVIAVGTTSTRSLESFADDMGRIVPGKRIADLTITPGYRFKVVDGILTNFHLPESSLLMLISTFGGHELIMGAYRHAVSQKYRFYSYGDCMLIV
jgi:S-adenosylmethionine:tRNA ribosyltransferase-isomerase